jgi:EAL domain-containing protein (putative c-di-GMP-specific phosphodiesterase class I)
MGVRIALDDCTPRHEFCSPELVQRVHPNILKIDGPLFIDCFARGLRKPLDEIIRLAKSIGAVVVAEHITTRDMCDWALDLNAGLLQGHYFGVASPFLPFNQPAIIGCA